MQFTNQFRAFLVFVKKAIVYFDAVAEEPSSIKAIVNSTFEARKAFHAFIHKLRAEFPKVELENVGYDDLQIWMNEAVEELKFEKDRLKAIFLVISAYAAFELPQRLASNQLRLLERSEQRGAAANIREMRAAVHEGFNDSPLREAARARFSSGEPGEATTGLIKIKIKIFITLLVALRSQELEQ